MPEEHGRIEAGHKAPTGIVDVEPRVVRGRVRVLVRALNLALELPDGTTIVADDGPIEWPTLGTTLPDQWVRFTIPDPAAGEYRFVLIDDTEDVRKVIPFEIG